MSQETRTDTPSKEENQHLREMLQAREAELAVLNSIQEALSAGEDIDAIFEIAGEQISEIFPGEGVALYTYDHETASGEAQFILEDGKRHYPPPFKAGPIGQKAANTKQTLVINNRKEYEEIGAITIEGTKPSLSGIYAPLLVNDIPVGALNIESTKSEFAFDEADVNLANTIARSLSVALENARLLGEAQQRTSELTIINDVQAGLASQLDLQEIYTQVGDRVKEIFDVEVVVIGRFDLDARLTYYEYAIVKGERLKIEPQPFNPIIEKFIQDKKTLLVNKGVKAWMESAGAPVVAGEQPLSVLSVPLLRDEKVAGSVSLQNVSREKAFSESDVQLLETLAASLMVALENARLFKETEERNAELAIINTMQHALAEELDLQGIYEAVGEKLREIFDSQVIAIYSNDHEARLSTIEYAYEKGQRFDRITKPLSSLHKYVTELDEPLVINGNFPEFAEQFEDYKVAAGELPRSIVSVPVSKASSGQTTVSITLQDVDGKRFFSEADVRLLETLGNSMGVALESARLFDDVQRSNRGLSEALEQQTATSEILRVMAMSQSEVQPVLEAVAENAARLCDGDDVQVYRLDRDRLLQVAHIGPLLALEDGESLPLVPGLITGRSVLDKRTIHIEDLAQVSPDEYPQSWELQKRLEHRSVIVTPLMREGQANGAIVVRRNKVQPFSDRQIALLATFADQAAIAIENVRLFNETQRLLKESEQRAAELQIINSVQEGLASKLDLQAIYDLIGEKIQEIFNADTTFIAFHDREEDVIYSPYYNDRGARTPSVSRKFGKGLAEHVILSGEALMLGTAEEMRELGSYEIASPGSDKDLNESFLGVPIYREGVTIGVTSVQSYKQHAFTQNDLTLLQTLANSMSVALDNARLFAETERLLEESQQLAAELVTINTVGQALVAEPDLDALVHLIGEQIRPIFAADIIYVAMLDEEEQMIRFPYTYGEEFHPLELGEGLTSMVIESGEALLINTDMDKRREEMGVKRVGKQAASYLGVPIRMGVRTVGVISVQNTSDEQAFCENDMRLLNTIAANVSVAIRNAQLFSEISHQKQYYEAVIENSPAAIVLLDMQANVTGWNPAAEQLFGYTEKEALGSNVDDLVAVQDDLHTEAVRYSQQALREKQLHLVTQRTRKDGSLVEVDVSGLPVSVDGEIVGFIAIYHDVTELQRARLAAEEANRAKSAFLANMSHELRTPLNAIIGFTRIVRRKGAETLPEKQLENLDKVHRSAEHLLNLINSVLDISKIEAGRLDVQVIDFEIEPLLREVADTYMPQLDEGVEMRVGIEAPVDMLHTDKEKVRQIFINLLSNAAKFTHRGKIVLSARQEGGCLYADVSDTGIGIPADALERVFEEFQQADTSTTRQYGGTGLGLSISRSLARLLGGDLTASSIEGKGSTFTLSIPLRFNEAQQNAEPSLESNEQFVIEKDKPLILSIDDDPDVHQLLEDNLSEYGYQVVGASSGDEGLQLAHELEPFAITLDIMMPKKDGWQVLHDLKQNPATRNIPVIMISIVDKKALGFRLGAADYLVKPLDEEAVLGSLNNLRKKNGGQKLKRLLVVDDDPNIPDMIHQLLEDSSFEIETAGDGEQAWEKINRSKPDAILLDLMMPRLDGFGFLQRVSQDESLSNVPVIVLTAKLLSDGERIALKDSVQQVIQKQGLSGEDLLAEIGQTIKQTL
jgi:PAS domain S-box-containing protein